MLNRPVSVYVGVDGPGRRHGLTALLGASADFELIGASKADDQCLRSVVVNRPRLLVLAGHLHDPPAPIAELIDKVRQGSPGTAIVALSAPDDTPSVPDRRMADLYLTPTSALTEIYAGILVAARRVAARNLRAEGVSESRKRAAGTPAAPVSMRLARGQAAARSDQEQRRPADDPGSVPSRASAVP
jgi:DNA-binding NarL/FixJ family response regulator